MQRTITNRSYSERTANRLEAGNHAQRRKSELYRNLVNRRLVENTKWVDHNLTAKRTRSLLITKNVIEFKTHILDIHILIH